ncbi:hypothetical protein QBK99_20975 [Corticibacterium sp. UT-5YL-CI-8]|nr:hypothetical protein [Tianweitania sp. UT-5YL-CI-8]
MNDNFDWLTLKKTCKKIMNHAFKTGNREAERIAGLYHGLAEENLARENQYALWRNAA